MNGRFDAYVPVFIHLGSRRVFMSPPTFNPSGNWLIQQIRNASIWLGEIDVEPTHLIRDRDSMYYGGRMASRGLGWVWFAGFTAWDLYDHHRTVSQNTPVMRGLLNGYFEELQNQILNDPQCGVFQTLETVRQELAGRHKEGP